MVCLYAQRDKSEKGVDEGEETFFREVYAVVWSREHPSDGSASGSLGGFGEFACSLAAETIAVVFPVVQ